MYCSMYICMYFGAWYCLPFSEKQTYLCNYVVGQPIYKAGMGWYFKTDGACTGKTVQSCVAKSSNKPIPLTSVDYL